MSDVFLQVICHEIEDCIGATGHIGGAVVDQLLSKHPDLRITGLFRDAEKARRYAQRFPTVEAVIGDLSDLGLLEEQSANAQIVINAAPDVYMPVTDAIARGLLSRSARAFYIHTSGAALIWDFSYGESSLKVWDDVADIDAIKSLPSGTTHKDTDDRVRSYASAINIAITSPTVVYGISPSPEHPTLLIMPDILSTLQAVGSGFVVGGGENRVTFVHVVDLAKMYVALVGDALRGPEDYNQNLWGVDAYYFGGDEEMQFRDFMESFLPLAKARGIVTTDNVKSLTAGEPAKAVEGRDDRTTHEWSAHIMQMFAVNMRCRSVRARKLLDYVPTEESVADSLPKSLDLFLERHAHT